MFYRKKCSIEKSLLRCFYVAVKLYIMTKEHKRKLYRARTSNWHPLWVALKLNVVLTRFFIPQKHTNSADSISAKFLNKLKHLKEKKMIRFFSDEKSFCPDQMYNKQKTGGSLPALRMFPN